MGSTGLGFGGLGRGGLVNGRSGDAVLPDDWPAVLPDYRQHVVGRFEGLRAWAVGLPGDDVWDFVESVLRLSRDSTPSQGSWAGPVHVYDLYTQYEGSRRSDQARFLQLVRWVDNTTGPPAPTVPVEPLPAPSPPWTSVHEVGYCYLELYRAEARGGARQRLGANPWAGELVADMFRHSGELSEGRFALSVREGKQDRDNPRAFRQVHVEPYGGGVRVRDVATCLTMHMRVGAALGDVSSLLRPQEDQTVPAVGSMYDRAANTGRTVIKMGVALRVGQDTTKWPAAKVNLLANPAFAVVTAPFESVRLEEAVFNVTVDPGDKNAAWCAITSPSTTLSGTMDWLACPTVTIVRSVESGVAGGRFELPADTAFARELKANLPGNDPPVFQFGYSGVAGTTAEIIGHVVLSVAGVGIMGHINVGGSGKSALMAVGQMVQAARSAAAYSMDTTPPAVSSDEPALPSLLEMFGIDDEDSDDEDEPPSRPRVGGAVSPTSRRLAGNGV